MAHTIVITRNGRTTVLTGWRAWTATAAGSLLAAALMVVIALFVVGAAITLATFLIFVVPLAILVSAVWAGLSGR